MIPRYAVIPTRGRPDDLERCISAIDDQVKRIFVIDNNDEPMSDIFPPWVEVIHNPMQPPNLSRLWNIGLEAVADAAWVDSGYPKAEVPHDVAIINDDAIVPSGWFQAMSEALRRTGAAAASQTPFGEPVERLWYEGTPGVHNRLTGWAFMLRGELGLRFDEQFQWWCGDDDISLRARQEGGVVHVPGFPVQNVHANESTVGLLAEISAADMQRFVDKHGVRPW